MSESRSFDEFDSLDELYGYMMSDGGEYDSDMVRGYIDRLPRCRESAEEILENMEQPSRFFRTDAVRPCEARVRGMPDSEAVPERSVKFNGIFA